MARIKQGVFSWEDVLAQRYQSNKPIPLTESQKCTVISTVRKQTEPTNTKTNTEETETETETESESESSPPQWNKNPPTPQPQSSLLTKLSPELRLMIWERALGGSRLHVIQRSGRRLGHAVCSELASCGICRGGLSQPVKDGFSPGKGRGIVGGSGRCQCLWTTATPSDASGFSRNGNGRTNGYDNYENGYNYNEDYGYDYGFDYLLGLPMTCKQIYTESLPNLYTQNTFEFSNPWTLPYLLPTLPTRYTSQIRSVELHWAFPGHWLPSKDPVKTVYVSAGRQQWIETCTALKCLEGLQAFRLLLAGNWFCEPVEKIPVFLEPLRGLKLKGKRKGGDSGSISGGGGGGGKKWTLVLPGQPYYVDEVDEIGKMLRGKGVECVVLVE